MTCGIGKPWIGCWIALASANARWTALTRAAGRSTFNLWWRASPAPVIRAGHEGRGGRGPVRSQQFQKSQDSSGGESVGRRRAVMRLLRGSSDPMSISGIADALGVHPNTVRFHLDSLVADGQVEHVELDRKGPGRPPLMFRAV